MAGLYGTAYNQIMGNGVRNINPVNPNVIADLGGANSTGATLRQGMLGGADMVNTSINDAINTGKQQYADKKAQEAAVAQQAAQQAQQQAYAAQQLVAPRTGLMSVPQLGAAADILAAKVAYDMHNANGAQYEAQGDAENAARAYALRDEVGRAAAAAREQYQQSGVEVPEGFGSGNTLADAQKALNMDRIKTLQSIFGPDMSSGEYYDKVVEDLMSRGMTRKGAEQEAGKRAGEYQRERMIRLSNAMQNYGMTERGSINGDVGVEILRKMAQEDDTAANLYANMFAHPKDDYTVDRGRENMAIENDYRKEAAQTQFQNTKALNEINHNYDLQKLEAQAQYKIQEMIVNGEIKTQQDLKRTEMEMENRKKWLAIYGAGLSPEEMRRFMLTGNLGGGGKSSSNSTTSGGGDDSMKQSEINSIIKAYNDFYKNNPKSAANPHEQKFIQALNSLYPLVPLDQLTDNTDAGHNAQMVLERNIVLPRGYRKDVDGLKKMIMAACGDYYGKAIIDQYTEDGTLQYYADLAKNNTDELKPTGGSE